MSGVVVGFDIPALLEIAERLGYDTNAIAFWLPMIESTIVDALCGNDTQLDEIDSDICF